MDHTAYLLLTELHRAYHIVGIPRMGLTGSHGLTVAISKHMIHYVISPYKNMLWLYNTFIPNTSLSLVFMKLQNCNEI